MSTGRRVPAAAQPAPGSVLVVDDEYATRYILSSWLRRAGYRVVEAATATEALEAAHVGDFDVVVLDVHLPDMSGLEVCRRLKADSRTEAASILHVSATAVEVGDRSAGLSRGAEGTVVSPIEPEEFIATTGALLRRARARQDAERRSAQLHQLSQAAMRVTVAIGSARLAVTAAEGVASLVGGPAVVALMSDPREAVSASCPGPGRSAEAVSVDPAAVRRLLAGRPGRLHGVDLQVPNSDAGGAGWDVHLIQQRGGEPVGLVALPGPSTDPHDIALVRQLVESVAVTHENHRLFVEEHRIALTLQRSLLPATLPDLPGLRLAARYQASNEQAEIGGDFFDAFETPDGCALVVIGDVQGHSLAAAVLMGELRYSLRAYAEDGYPPDEVLGRLNRLLLRRHPDTTATVCIVQLSSDRSVAGIANAGHIPPLLSTVGGSAEYLEHGGPLLGVRASPADPYMIPFPHGARLLLVTDGLIERRDRSLQVDMEELAVDFAADRRDLDTVGDALMARPQPGGDDAALVLIEHTGSLP